LQKGPATSVLSMKTEFKVDRSLMILFYKSYIELILTFSLLCWYGSIGVKAKTALVKIVNTSGKILGVTLLTCTTGRY